MKRLRFYEEGLSGFDNEEIKKRNELAKKMVPLNFDGGGPVQIKYTNNPPPITSCENKSLFL